MDEMKRIDAATAFLAERLGTDARIAIVLGSGLGAFAEALTAIRTVAFDEIPHFPTPAVVGHKGRIVAGKFQGRDVIAVQGRYHLFEGFPLVDIVRPIRVLGQLGVKTLILTNACGAIHPDFHPGELMLIADHLNLTGTNPLFGMNLDQLGPRFPDASEIYGSGLRKIARDAAKQLDLTLREGVYAWWSGPSYETPAEIRMIRMLGADAVGMSTVPEALAASHMGIDVLGIACLTNMATGISQGKLSHADVLETAVTAGVDLSRLLASIVLALPK